VFDLSDIFSYSVITGFAFVALCAMTRGGRGWPWRLLGLLSLMGVDVLMEFMAHHVRMTDELWVALFFVLGGCVMSALIVMLSRDSFGRRLFLSLVYAAYGTSYASVFNFFAYRLSCSSCLALALAGVVVLNVMFLVWVLPQMPRECRDFDWRTPCCIAGAMLVLLFACGLWPVSIVAAPARFCIPFVLLSAAAWVGFPILCRAMREHARRIAAEQSAALMMSEVKVRRAALDEARRIRHDRRHHLIVLGNLLVRGQAKEALDYVSSLDDGTALGAAAHVWCANETINALLAGYARKAAEKGVAFSAEAHVEGMAPLPDAELVAVVANLVENAINAVDAASCRVNADVEKFSQTRQDAASTGDAASTEAKVTVALRQRGELFGLTVTNDVSPDFLLARNGLPCDEPGVGLESVRRVVERYSGEWVYTLADGRLTCELALCGGCRT